MSSYNHHARRARLSELSRRVLNAAEQLALSLGHTDTGIGHLLLVMVQESRSPTSPLLLNCGLDADRLYTGLIQADAALLVSIDPLLSHLRELVERSGSHYTGTEHLLLMLLEDGTGQTVLYSYGVQLAVLEQHLQPE